MNITARTAVDPITLTHKERFRMKKTRTVELPFTVSVRFNEQDFRRLVAMAQAGRRNLSQTVRLLIEAALRADR